MATKRKLPVGVYEKKNAKNLWTYYPAPPPFGRQDEDTGTLDPREAARYRDKRFEEIARGTWQPKKNRISSRMTLEQWMITFIPKRSQLKGWRSEEGRIKNHILPYLGHYAIDDITDEMVEDWIESLKKKGALSNQSIIHCHSHLSWYLRRASKKKLITGMPWMTERGVLPPAETKDPEFYEKAVYTPEQVHMLLFDERIPYVRRVFHALKYFLILRVGEAAGRRFRDYNKTKKPLAMMHVWSQFNDEPLKTRMKRKVPVHPVLEDILDAWWTKGFRQFMGREPEENDFIVPNDEGSCRRYNNYREMGKDCLALGFPPPPARQHAMRATANTMVRDGEADRFILRCITHSGNRDVQGRYERFSWGTLCRQILKMTPLEDSDSTPPLPPNKGNVVSIKEYSDLKKSLKMIL